MSRLTEGYNKKIKNLTRKQKMCIIILSLKGGFMIFMDKKDKASISVIEAEKENLSKQIEDNITKIYNLQF